MRVSKCWAKALEVHFKMGGYYTQIIRSVSYCRHSRAGHPSVPPFHVWKWSKVLPASSVISSVTLDSRRIVSIIWCAWVISPFITHSHMKAIMLSVSDASPSQHPTVGPECTSLLKSYYYFPSCCAELNTSWEQGSRNLDGEQQLNNFTPFT